MPIEHGIQSKPISDDEFHSLDYEVMALAFSIHGDLGRFWNEKIYQNELAYRCQRAGFENVVKEVPIKVSFKDFTKSYYIDLMINNVIYELKTAETLTGQHQKQTINYLLLTGLNHAKLINMRPPSVEHRFVSTKIRAEQRFDFALVDEHWLSLDEESVWLKRIFTSLLEEWGLFLDINLFYDAIVHFRGGEEHVVEALEVMDGPRSLGRQKVYLLNSEIAFKVSSVTTDVGHYEQDFRRLVRYTSLKAIQWINFNHHRIEFKTILKQ